MEDPHFQTGKLRPFPQISAPVFCDYLKKWVIHTHMNDFHVWITHSLCMNNSFPCMHTSFPRMNRSFPFMNNSLPCMKIWKNHVLMNIYNFFVWITNFLVWTTHVLVWITRFFCICKTHLLAWTTNSSLPYTENSYQKNISFYE